MLRGRNRQKGMAAVEFGLVLPIVLVIFFGIFEFGLAFWRKQVLTTAVREGARSGVVATNPRKTCDEISTTVKDYLKGAGWDNVDAKATVTPSGCPSSSGNDLTVTATFPTSFLILSRLPTHMTVDGDGNVILSATIVMQGE